MRQKKLEALYRAVLLCLDPTQPLNQKALDLEYMISAKIPARLWNQVKAAATDLGAHEDIWGKDDEKEQALTIRPHHLRRACDD